MAQKHFKGTIAKTLISLTLLGLTPSSHAAYSYTYEDVMNLKKTNPKQANAYLKGIAEAAFFFHSTDGKGNLFCPPRGTKVDIEFVNLIAFNEVKLHRKPKTEFFMALVRDGLTRTYPC